MCKCVCAVCLGLRVVSCSADERLWVVEEHTLHLSPHHLTQHRVAVTATTACTQQTTHTHMRVKRKRFSPPPPLSLSLSLSLRLTLAPAAGFPSRPLPLVARIQVLPSARSGAALALIRTQQTSTHTHTAAHSTYGPADSLGLIGYASIAVGPAIVAVGAATGARAAAPTVVRCCCCCGWVGVASAGHGAAGAVVGAPVGGATVY